MTMKNRASTDWLVVHCAATPPNLDIGRAEIDRWHRQKGWLMIGYHYVIRRNGAIETGRPETSVGAHVEGHNSNSIGISLVGGVDAKGNPDDNFTSSQYATLAELLRTLKAKYPKAQVLGHRDFPGVTKACPSFDVRSWLRETGVFEKQQPVVNPKPVAGTRPEESWLYHTVAAGDTLFSLARVNQTTVDTILALNPKTNLKTLKVGITIRVR